jgi:RNA polymerase sigma-70 factor, ECF subfamily
MDALCTTFANHKQVDAHLTEMVQRAQFVCLNLTFLTGKLNVKLGQSLAILINIIFRSGSPDFINMSNVSKLMWKAAEPHPKEDKSATGVSDSTANVVVQRAQEGDETALTELYTQYKPGVYRYLYYRTGIRQVAEELTTEVFIRVIESLPRYHSKNVPFQSWLFRIARNLAIDHFRRHNTHQSVDIDENLVIISEGTEAIVERNLDLEQLHQALLKLSPSQCDVIVLRFLADMPIRQVAQVLKKSEGAVKMLQARALETLSLRMKQ